VKLREKREATYRLLQGRLWVPAGRGGRKVEVRPVVAAFMNDPYRRCSTAGVTCCAAPCAPAPMIWPAVGSSWKRLRHPPRHQPARACRSGVVGSGQPAA
jgi:hypothetical protein